MFGNYRAVFRAPGTARFCAAAVVMRFPIALYPFGLGLIVSASCGHYGFAGVLSGIYVIANGVGNPLLARVSDRYGQRRLLIPASVVHAAGAVLLASFVELKLPDWTLIGPTIVTGLAFLSVGSMVRARWSNVLAGSPDLSTAYSLESTLDEVVFVLGPLVATTVATLVWPPLVLYIGAALVLVGAVLFTRAPGEPPPHPQGEKHPAALRTRGMPLLVLTAVCMGVIFASAEVTMVAFCGQHGHKSLSGVPLAAFAGGSAVAGLLYGARKWARPILARYRLQCGVFGALTFVFLLAVNIPVLVLCAFVVGLGIAPALITTFGVVEQLVPAAALTEGLAWVITGLSVGYGVGAALVGAIADHHGARVAFVVTAAAGVLGALIAAVEYRALAGASEPVAV